ncbi:glycosyltransferase family 1 protein [Kluyvera georgiana]|uniref:glycosyltransferase family 4 protein n=1 Tax=Kluyvera georgiana TaxID=73098 RepID=UPI0032202BD7
MMIKVIYSTDCIKYPLTGIGRYAYELAKTIQYEHSDVDLKFMHGLKVLDELTNAKEKQTSSQNLKRSLQNSKVVSDIYRNIYPLAKSFVLKKHKKTIYHGTNFYLPPRVDNTISTFHDLSVFHWPQCHPAGRVHLMQKELANAINRTRMILTVSEFIKKEIVEYFDVNPEKVIVSPLGYNEQFRPREQFELAEVLSKYNLKYKSYSLYTGTIEPRKNLLAILKAYGNINIGIRKQYPLVISGYKGWDNDNIYKLIDKGQREGWVTYLGYVPSAELPLLYNGATAFLFPSIYEGFGLPVLEALASGTPVICSSAASLPEVYGEAALSHDPDDVDKICAHLERVISDSILRENLKTQGIERAKLFSWSRCANQTVIAYKRVAENLC